jgi:Polyketide cyclase / dehydrase and lipid transport
VHDSVTVHMAATPEQVWAVVSDVTRIGRYSPETFEAEWLDGATGPALGARFRGHVKRNQKGPTYWTTATVTACEPGQTFAFAVGAPGKPLNVWRYDIVPAGDGCDVTESFTLSPTWWLRLYWTLLGWARGKTNREGMRTTLERMRAELEAAPASGGPTP